MKQVVRINKENYTRFMRIQLAKSGLSFTGFANSLGICPNTYYSFKHLGRIANKHYNKMKEVLGNEKGFDGSFTISFEEHGNKK